MSVSLQKAFHTLVPPKSPKRKEAKPIKVKQVLHWHDDKYGDFKTEFEITMDYRLEAIIGNGSYGIVAGGIHLPTNEKVAVKRLDLFDQNSMVCMRALREIKLLSYFQHPNIVDTIDIQFSKNRKDLKYVYIIQKFMESDLHRVIRTQNLTDDHIRFFTFQLLRGLNALHRENIIHRDLKPGNILINSLCGLKICDLGLARMCNPHDGRKPDRNDPFMTEYVATRWYRAPELLISKDTYGTAMDMWSVGCIVAEMLGGTALFPGRNYANQLAQIMGVLGQPDPERVRKMTTFGRPLILNSKVKTPIPFKKLYPRANPLLLDLLSKLLTFFPEDRITCEMALAHPYFKNMEEIIDNDTTEPIGLPDDFFKFEYGTSRMNYDDLQAVAFNELSSIAAEFKFNDTN